MRKLACKSAGWAPFTNTQARGKLVSTDAGWSSLVARRAHNPKVAGSNPAPATHERPAQAGLSFSLVRGVLASWYRRGTKVSWRPAYSAGDTERVPRLGSLYPKFESKIRRLPTKRPLVDRDILRPAFRLEREGDLEIYYAPMDWLRPTARVSIVGITPGKGTMLLAYGSVSRGLAEGRGPTSVLNDAKDNSFSGFRSQLVEWLDWLGIASALGLETSAMLWKPGGRRLLHPTSAIRYPTFRRGENYSGGSPPLVRHPMLRRYLAETLAPELERIPDALIIPLGVQVAAGIAHLSEADLVSPARCLVGFPHPSGQNGHRMKHWRANREGLKRKVRAWFVAHPVR